MKHPPTGCAPGDDDGEQVARLQARLAPLRYRGRLPELPARAAGAPRAEPRRRLLRWCAAALLLLGVGLGSAHLARRILAPPAAQGPGVAWAYQRQGPHLEAPAPGLLAVGEWLRTDGRSRVRLEVADVGRLEVHPDTALRLLRSGPDEHRLRLERGRVEAWVLAPPRLFLVETPAALAVDLGCAYELTVDEHGDGWLEVTSGWVALERDGRESRVPAGARCAMRRASGPGTPHRTGAPHAYVEALARVDLVPDDPALAEVLARSQADDALTLWHLLARVAGERRAAVYDRLADLVPPPEAPGGPGAAASTGRLRERTLALDPEALDAWWEEIRW